MTPATSAERERVREIVQHWGWNGTSFQILNPGFRFWFDPAGDAVVGFVTRHGIRVVGGGPVCADDRLADVMAAFETAATSADEGVVYFCAEDRLARLAGTDARRITFPIGAQPVWQPHDLLHSFAAHASLRAQLNRARNKNVRTRQLTHIDASANNALQRCLREWIDGRSLPPLHFLVETQTLDERAGRQVFVAERNGVAIGFLVATPIPARDGWLIEQIVRGHDAPNGTAELLLHHATRVLAGQNATLITLGLAPLARRGTPVVDRAPPWLRTLLDALRSHGRRFYNFEGLEAFKAKFGSTAWEPVYASLAPGTTLPRALLAVTTAFSGEPLRTFGPRLVWRVISREVRRIVDHDSSR